MRFLFYLILVSTVLIQSSCRSTKPLVYLQGIDTAGTSSIQTYQPVLQKGDIISIVVFSDNSAASAQFNQPIVMQPSSVAGSANTGESGAGQANNSGYIIDDAGFIQFPVLRKVKAEGLTVPQLDSFLVSQLKPYLNNPYLEIRIKNFKVTVLGEVGKPGTISLPNARLNILEAIGLSGDLTFFGRRENILVIREENGVRTTGRIDLTKPDIFSSPYFLLHQNDIVVVEMNKKKVAANDQVFLRNVSIGTAVLSTLAIVYNILRN